MTYSENCFWFENVGDIRWWLDKRIKAQREAVRWVMVECMFRNYPRLKGELNRLPNLVDVEDAANEEAGDKEEAGDFCNASRDLRTELWAARPDVHRRPFKPS
jgi:hypothetical protein